MKIKNSFLVCFLIFGFFSFSQKVQLKKADANYDQFHYVNAIKTYEKVANKFGNSDGGSKVKCSRQ